MIESDAKTLKEFQSTLLMRGATGIFLRRTGGTVHFNPRSSCEERRTLPAQFRPATEISIHAPHARSDLSGKGRQISEPVFQSTLLMRGATRQTSVHDLTVAYFNPRSSCEERRRHPLMAVTKGGISIHAPHARSDSVKSCMASSCLRFQSTLLMRGATDEDTDEDIF